MEQSRLFSSTTKSYLFIVIQVLNQHTHQTEDHWCILDICLLDRSHPICLLLLGGHVSLQRFPVRLHLLRRKLHLGSLLTPTSQSSKQESIRRDQPWKSICRLCFCTHHSTFGGHEFHWLSFSAFITILRPNLNFLLVKFGRKLYNYKDTLLTARFLTTEMDKQPLRHIL